MKTTLAILAVLLLGTCSQPPSVLQQILELGEIRVVTRNSPSAYYLGAQGPVGPEFDLASAFAAEIGVALHIYTVPSLAEVYAEIASGRAHVAAAGLTRHGAAAAELVFGPPYQQIREHLVYRLGTRKPRDLAQANSGHIEVVSRGPHANTLRQLRRGFPELTWVENPDTETEELLYRLSQRQFDYTVADSNEFAVSRSFHPEIRIAFDLSQGNELAWAVVSRDDSLLERVTAFFMTLRAEGRLASILDRYYGHAERFDYIRAREFIRHVETRLPLYRQWFKEAGAAVGIDWRLLAAIGYQESKWDPEAVSPTGVRGLMMLTETTALSLDVRDRTDPQQSILGGARYLQRIRELIPERIDEPDRTWFALAAYNVGFGHLEDARIITQMHGRNPDRWENVREYLPLLSQEKWYTRVKRGYARGWEPVRYVENVRSYIKILDWVASDTGRPALRVDDQADLATSSTRGG